MLSLLFRVKKYTFINNHLNNHFQLKYALNVSIHNIDGLTFSLIFKQEESRANEQRLWPMLLNLAILVE